MNEDENQILLIDKPAGISSFGVVAKIRGYMRKKFGKKVKVGHTGTLDPFATGLLVILTGKNTKKSDEFLKKDKVYEATLKLGFTSTTGDPEGEITEIAFSKHGEVFPQEKLSDSPDFYNISPQKNSVSEANIKNFSEAEDVVKITPREYYPRLEKVISVINSFIGDINQKVPQYSAIKINGERAYKLARAGKSFDTPTRKVTIYNIEVLEYNFPILKIRTHVSSGTYIRALAEDIGEKLGTGAYLTELRRTKIADYDVKDASKLEDFVI